MSQIVQHTAEASSTFVNVEINERGIVTNMNTILAGFADGIPVNTVFGLDRPVVRDQIANKLRALRATIDDITYDHPRYARWTAAYRAGVQHLEEGYRWSFWFLAKI
ncbi:hypothetical protein [Glutamicibacter ardleyensis]|uniref:hypothetical protein n=1 Tax=Glutamicibacter ardleyensis TaxID=225894 RepID=UPI003FD1AC13